MQAEFGFNEHHQNEVISYMRFARSKRVLRLKTIDTCFEELKDSRCFIGQMPMDIILNILGLYRFNQCCYLMGHVCVMYACVLSVSIIDCLCFVLACVCLRVCVFVSGNLACIAYLFVNVCCMSVYIGCVGLGACVYCVLQAGGGDVHGG